MANAGIRFSLGISISAGMLLSVALAGCGEGRAGSEPDGRKLVVATTTMIADLARQLGGEHVRVVCIMRPGTDPHIYEPTPEDSILFRKADLVLVNGLHLEGRMLDMIESAGTKVSPLGQHPKIRLRESAAAGAPDPHVWWNVGNFIIFAEQTRDALKQIAPEHTEAFDRRAATYIGQLAALDAWVRDSVHTIPERSRYMITSHDAFYYFGEAYGLEVDAVLGISTDAQARAGEQDRLARIVAERKIPAIFHETSVSAAQNELVDGIRRLAKEKYGHDLQIAGSLYSDSLGDAASRADNYVNAVIANTRMIVAGLGGQVSDVTSVMAASATATQPTTARSPDV
jgi:ABC-type Zn uptake system ZnuABC Zn-binding protein ZnuA